MNWFARAGFEKMRDGDRPLGDFHGLARAARRLKLTIPLRPPPARLFASVGLSVLFLVVYGGCNWFTAQRGDVGTLHFAWERHIPFVPVMIAPVHVDRSVLCRGAIPLPTDPRAARLRAAHRGRDPGRRSLLSLVPVSLRFRAAGGRRNSGSNLRLVPRDGSPIQPLSSLHVALGLLLAQIYARHSRGLLRVALLTWFG